MSEYKPGSFAVVTFRADDMRKAETLPGIRWAGGWAMVDASGSHELIADRIVSDVRPLVVLDLSPHEVMRALEALRESRGMVALEVAAKLEAATKPPKPAEPTGLGAVVEDSEGEVWVRFHTFEDGEHWAAGGPNVKTNHRYDEIDVVRVLSDGWEPKP